MIDCHAHLGSAAFDADRGAVLERARQAKVARIVTVGEDYADDLRVLEVCRTHPDMLVPALGLHPDRFAEDRPLPGVEELDAVVALARAEAARLVALGEVGLDYWLVKSEERRAAQRRCLERMVELGRELSLPLNVHSRSAGHHALDLLQGAGATRVLMHAFDGKVGHALRAWEKSGYLFSIPPSVVRSEQKQKLVKRLPLEALALESDSPVLGPEPGTRNEPANLRLTVELVARAKGVDPERVIEVTRDNARALFALPRAPGSLGRR
jgi:TatD DNase family protein